MDVQMRDRFATIGSIVDHQAEARFREACLPRDFPSGEEEVTQNCLIFGCGFGDSWNRFFGNHQPMGGCLWGNVFEGEAKIIFVKDLGREFSVPDFLKKRLLRHAARLARAAWDGKG